MNVRDAVATVTQRIAARSHDRRTAYLEQIEAAASRGVGRRALSCGNLAHAAAGCTADREGLFGDAVNIGIVTAYNDMLSAHQPFATYPDLLKAAARRNGATAQVAGGVPAMCDGVTQGRPGMDLSLLSRDVIAMSTAVSLSHDTYDGGLLLGVCDKIVPGLLIGALSFGHLPFMLVPAGPMPSGLANAEKKRVREAHAKGEVDDASLLAAEAASYHAPGTCTFYGTANTNQLLMEVMGLHVPGASFVPEGTPLRSAVTEAAVEGVLRAVRGGAPHHRLGHLVDERAIVNAIVALMATGGSSNLVLHLVAIARAAGLVVRLEDLHDLSQTTPLMVRMYPNGAADVNAFHDAGGTSWLIAELLDAGLLHGDAKSMWGDDLHAQAKRPCVAEDGGLRFDDPGPAGDDTILRPASSPFAPTGGLRLVEGALGRGVVKVSAVPEGETSLTAPAAVFDDQAAVKQAFAEGSLSGDHVIVVRFQGPQANGMPELHGLAPILGALRSFGHRVALVTDGRLSGASGATLSAIHVGPEAARGGPLARLRTGDVVTVDADNGLLTTDADLDSRSDAPAPPPAVGWGRELFNDLRRMSTDAEHGASVLEW